MGTDPYHRQPQNVQIEAMDLGETLTHQETLPPDFAQAALVNGHLSSMGSSQAMQETIPVFADMGDPSAMITSNHVPLSDAPANATFMTPMDVVQQPPIPDNVYIPANVPLNDPYSMITPVDSPMVLETNQVSHPSGMQPATHIQASTLVDAMQTGMNPMLDSTLMPQVAPVTQMQMNPAMPSMAPSFINPAVPNLPPTMTPPQEEVTPEALNNALSGMLFEIENTAKHARQALSDKEDVTGSKVNRVLTSPLKDCISQMFTNLLTISSALESSTYTPPLQSPSIVLEQKESPLSLPSTSSSASSPMEVPTENRKRSASGLDDDRRSVKSLKRESPDSVALTAPYAEPSSSALDGSQSFPITKLSLHANGSQTVLPLGSPTSVSSQSSFATRGFAQGTPLPPTPTFPSFNGVPMASPIESSLSLSHGSIAPLFPGIQTAWSDSVVPTRHQHSSSLESLPGAQLQVPTSDPVNPAIPDALSGFMPQGASQPATPPNPVPIGVPIGRMSRSGSITGTFTPFTFAASLDNASEPGSLWANSLSRVPGNPPVQQSPPVWNNGVEKAGSSLSPSPVSDRINLAAPPAAVNRTSPPTADEDEDDEGDSDDEDSGGKHSRMSDGSHPSSANDVPMEYRAEVERIFFDFLNGICSNLDATDSKGEPIHQTLMAKKMQRLDESPDFRPFKFRIQAFTHAFLEELAKYGYTDDKIPMKKVRNFLWRSPYILRFNEDGKKAKSKGNHIWNIEAKKVGEGKWEFRPFQRKLAGTPPSIAYCGLKWSWSPHVWDPQASLSNAPVEYSSPVLPHWLSWNRNVLSGTPPPDAESCQITVNAKFVVDGQDCSLSHTFNLTIAPVKSIENQSIARSRRPSLVNEAPRRTASDSVLFQTVQRAKPRPAPSSADNRVIRVLQSVAQRVTEEAATQSIVASQSIVNSPPEQEELQVLEKQKIVLDQSVNAFDKALSGTTVVADRRLAVAAQNVVVQAAHSVLADRSIAGGGVPVKHPEAVAVKNVTVSELSEATQDAIALAVKQEGPASSGVDIMVAATTILKLRTAGSSSENLAALAAHPPAVPARPLSGSAKRLSKISAHPLSSVTEYVA